MSAKRPTKKELQDERIKVAEMRFQRYVIDGHGPRRDYPFGVTDALASPVTIAKFKSHTDADTFVTARKLQYINTGQ